MQIPDLFCLQKEKAGHVLRNVNPQFVHRKKATYISKYCKKHNGGASNVFILFFHFLWISNYS